MKFIGIDLSSFKNIKLPINITILNFDNRKITLTNKTNSLSSRKSSKTIKAKN